MICKDELRIFMPFGTLQGTTYISEFQDHEYCAFLGIPYAEPPLNELRFMPPLPIKEWNRKFLDATKEGNPCIHFCNFRRVLVGSEDCLYLNVYTPEPPCRITTPKAVLVQIHCGGNNWGSGSSDNFGSPDFIVHHNIIYVTFNYRLHALGFLNLNLSNCAGNMGLKDQVMALRWIKENIKYFGGDPNNVTLHGSSAGATDIHFHMMSPLSKGLFHKVILQGGYAFSPVWSMMDNPIERAFEFARLLGFNGNDNIKRLLRFFKQVEAKELTQMSGPLRALLRQRNGDIPEITPFRPSIEMFEEGAFLPSHPRTLVHNVAPVPMLADICEAEGSFMFLIDACSALKRDMSRVIERNLWLYKMTPQTLKYVTNKIQSFYFDEETQYDKVPMLVLKLFSDMWTCEWQEMADYQAEVAPVYLFFFKYVGELNYQKLFFIRMLCSEEVSQQLGTCHADDSCYLTNYNKIIRHMKKIPAPFNQDAIKVINNMAKICTNFAKNGNPNGGLSENVEWRAHTQRDPCYLKFDLNLEVINGIINEDRTQFWKDLINYIKEHE